MIHQLCNLNNEISAAFNQAVVIKLTSLTSFNHLTDDQSIQDIISNIPESSEAIVFDFLPENKTLNYITRNSAAGRSYRLTSSFVVTPLDKNLQSLLERYNNELVVLLVKKQDSTFLYGTTTSPLLFLYNEKHSNKDATLKGYTVKISGDCLGASKQFENIDLNIFNRGLAFELAGPL